MADRGRRAFPWASAIIHEHDYVHAYSIHRERVKTMKPAIDTAPPADYVHFHYNAKRAMQQAERLFEIERENRILLEKMERYAAYTGSTHFRPWTCRSSLNFKQGMVYAHSTQSLHIDHMNVPVNEGTPAGGNRKSDYRKAQELQHLAKENLKILKAIESRKPFYSARDMEHEYLENVSRIDRLSTFRGPRSAQHRPKLVDRNLEIAKSMRQTQHRAGTDGYQRDLAKSMSRSMKVRQGPIVIEPPSSRGSRGQGSTISHRPESVQSARYRPAAYADVAEQSLKKVATMSRSATLRRNLTNSRSMKSFSARPAARASFADDLEFRQMFDGGSPAGHAILPADIPMNSEFLPQAEASAPLLLHPHHDESVTESKGPSSAADAAEDRPASSYTEVAADIADSEATAKPLAGVGGDETEAMTEDAAVAGSAVSEAEASLDGSKAVSGDDQLAAAT